MFLRARSARLDSGYFYGSQRLQQKHAKTETRDG